MLVYLKSIKSLRNMKHHKKSILLLATIATLLLIFSTLSIAYALNPLVSTTVVESKQISSYQEPATFWIYNTEGHVLASPTIGDVDNDGMPEVVIGGDDGKMYVINGEDGSILWYNYTGHPIFSSAAIGDINNDGNLEIVVGDKGGFINAFNGQNGSLIWSFEIYIEVLSSPALGDINGDGWLEVVIGGGNKIYALDGETGLVLWEYETGDNVWSSPALGDIDDDGNLEVIVGSYDNFIYALNGEDGTLLWTFRTGDIIWSSPSLGDVDNDGDLDVVIGSYDWRLYAIDGKSGEELWFYAAKGAIMSSPAIGDVDGDGKLEVIIGDVESDVYVVNGEDGTLLWSYSTGGYIPASPALGDVDGDDRLEVVIGSGDGGLYAFQGEDGSVLWIYKTRDCIESTPAIWDLDNDGVVEIVVGSDDNRIYALKSSSEVSFGIRTYWSCFGGDPMHNRNTRVFDPDNDFASTFSEIIFETDPYKWDTDGDGMPDGWEIFYGFNARDAGDAYDDPDRDDLTNIEEYQSYTNPYDSDSDDDELMDGEEVEKYHTDPLNPDTDDDGIIDGWEARNGYDPLDPAVGPIEFIHFNLHIFLPIFGVVGIGAIVVTVRVMRGKGRKRILEEIATYVQKANTPIDVRETKISKLSLQDQYKLVSKHSDELIKKYHVYMGPSGVLYPESFMLSVRDNLLSEASRTIIDVRKWLAATDIRNEDIDFIISMLMSVYRVPINRDMTIVTKEGIENLKMSIASIIKNAGKISYSDLMASLQLEYMPESLPSEIFYLKDYGIITSRDMTTFYSIDYLVDYLTDYVNEIAKAYEKYRISDIADKLNIDAKEVEDILTRLIADGKIRAKISDGMLVFVEAVPAVRVPAKVEAREMPTVAVPGYKVQGVIGVGGFATVFRAIDPQGRPVALKILNVKDQEALKSFIREVAIWKTLDHPNIVRLISYGLEPLPHISMELMDGTLRNILNEKGKLDEKEALKIILDIALGLQYAHKDFYLVHRDIKPENILYKGDVYKLSDWGLGGLQTLIVTGELKGTVAYFAPEQFDPSFGNVSQWTDVWQLGAVLYEIVAGEPPFGKELNVVVNRVLREEPKRPEGISDSLWQLIKDMLKKNPTERPTMYDVISRIRAMQGR